MPVIDDDGNIREWVGVHRNITGDRERERDLHEAKLAAETASRAKSTFLANMSLELRTPLNAIIGCSKLLAEEAADRGTVNPGSDLEKIRVAGRHLLPLIESVLDLSKIEAGRMEVFAGSIGVKHLFEEIIAVVGPLADRNGNRIEVQVEPRLVLIVTDQIKLTCPTFLYQS